MVGYAGRIHDLAEKIAEDGVWNFADGGNMMDIIFVLDHTYRRIEDDEDARYQRVFDELRLLDDAYGWNNPHQSEETEDLVLGLYVRIYRLSAEQGRPWKYSGV